MQRLLSQNKSSMNDARYSFQQPPDVANPPAAAPPASVTHERIDVRAQFALSRLFKGPANDSKDAVDLFNDVDSGKIKGIFGDDLGIAATLASKRGTVRWELVPKGQDAVMLNDESPDTPVIIFKASAATKPRLDQALLTVYRAHKATLTPAPAAPANSTTPIVIPAGHPAFTADGSPNARPSRTIVRDGDVIDTRDDLLTFDWTAQIKTDTPSSSCFEVGFLQTVTRSSVFADYNSGPNDATPGLCMPFMPRLPMRDGFAASPVWFIGPNSKGIGFNVIGTCQPSFPIPFTVPASSQAGVTTVDKPGGPFNLHHPSDNTKLLRQVSEDLEFKVWLAARLKSDPEGSLASYQFIKNATWVVERTTEFTHGAAGQVSFQFTRNETKVTEFGDGQGGASPDLGSDRANTAVMNLCVP